MISRSVSGRASGFDSGSAVRSSARKAGSTAAPNRRRFAEGTDTTYTTGGKVGFAIMANRDHSWIGSPSIKKSTGDRTKTRVGG
jgi:hypothetical protein